MSEMVERVAQAICGDANPANILTIHRIRARQAIEAMREPTYPMIDAGGEAIYHLTGDPTPAVEAAAQAAWPAMIDAALK